MAAMKASRSSSTMTVAKKHEPRDLYNLSDSDSPDDMVQKAAKAPKKRKKGQPTSGPPGTETLEDVRLHLGGRWRRGEQRKDHPERMSKERQRMEYLYNPLIKLLKIRLEDADSDDEKGVPIRTKTTEEVNSDQERSSDESDDGFGGKTKSIKTSAKDEVWLGFSQEIASNIKDDPEGEDVKPFIKSANSDVEMELKPDIKPKLEPCLTVDNDEEEPPTDDEEQDSPLVKTEADLSDDDDELVKMLKHEKAARRQGELLKAKAKTKEAFAANFAAMTQEKRKTDEEKAQRVAAGGKDVEMEQSEDEDKRKYPLTGRHGRPNFDIKSHEQYMLGPHRLGVDSSGAVYEIPQAVNRHLRPYQRAGAQFFYNQFAKGKGAILGDDMGLGKTIQVIAFLCAVMRKSPGMGLDGVKGKKVDRSARKDAVKSYAADDDDEWEGDPGPSAYGQTCLIICPASVVHNWAAELKTWTYLNVLIYSGGAKDRKSTLDMFRRGYADIVITGIETARINIGDLQEEDFSIVIIDEAHRVKNPLSQTTKAMQEFPTKLRFGLTGTALQNRQDEFWCLLNWAFRNEVGTRNNWNLYIARPLKYVQKIDAAEEQLAIGRVRAVQLVDNLLPHFWLRRTKDQVKIQLPQKRDKIVICPLTKEQSAVYKRILSLPDIQQVILGNSEPCDCGREDEDGHLYPRKYCCYQHWPKLILKYITLLQKVANHLALIYPDNTDLAKNEDKYNQDLDWCRAAFPNDHTNRLRGGYTAMDPTLCGKWKILHDLLQLWKQQGDKVLIFSLSLKVLELVRERMESTAFNYLELNGSIPNDKRMDLVNEFNTDPNVFAFLISTRAGGVGLNLTAANRVVIFDPNWNPSHDLQAMDRAYRFGQTRDVEVYRLVGAGTLEELIYNRQQYKRAQANQAYEATAERRMFEGVEGEKEDRGELFGINNIFKYNEHSSLTEMSMKACDMAELEFVFKNAALMESSDSTTKKSKLKKRRGQDGDDDHRSSAEETDEDGDAVLLRNLLDAPKQMTTVTEDPARIEAEKKRQVERTTIDRLLAGAGVTVSFESDAALGSTRAEEARARQAIAASRKPKVPATSRPDKKSAASSRYDPLARKKKKPIQEAAPTPASASSNALAQLSMMRDKSGAAVELSDVLSASGYRGKDAMARLNNEMKLMSAAQVAERASEMCHKYKETQK